MGLKEYLKARQNGIDLMATSGTIGLHMVSGPIVGFVLALCIEYFVQSGTPWIKLGGLFIGIIAGFINVYEDSKRLLNKMQAEDDKKFGSRP